MAARAHRKGFSPTLPSDGWQSEDRDGPWESYKERCVHEGAHVKNYTSGECIEWLNVRGHLHREDGPAIEDHKGNKVWYVNGQHHRLDGPAIERANGYKEWRVNGRQHREDGPAIIYSDGYKEWMVNGRLHRLDGPAIEYSDGTVAFFKDDIRYTDITFTQRFY